MPPWSPASTAFPQSRTSPRRRAWSTTAIASRSTGSKGSSGSTTRRDHINLVHSLTAYLFSAAGILGVLVLALMGRRHVRLPQGFGRDGNTVWHPRTPRRDDRTD